MNETSNLPIPRTTLSQMVDAYVLAEHKIRQAYGLLIEASQGLKFAFGEDGYKFDFDSHRHESVDYTKPEQLLKKVKKDAWSSMIDKMELRRILSLKRIDELDKQIETGDGLPELTLPNILAMFEGTLNNAAQYLGELVREVYEWLRPANSQYKTNPKFEIEKRVIRPYCVERWHGGKFHVNHYRHDQLRALDRVFHALDGKGYPKTYNGPLHDAIEKCGPDGKGETDYFRFKCYMNHNLHIEFKRLDLVAKFNQVAGGMRLRAPTVTGEETKSIIQ